MLRLPLVFCLLVGWRLVLLSAVIVWILYFLHVFTLHLAEASAAAAADAGTQLAVGVATNYLARWLFGGSAEAIGSSLAVQTRCTLWHLFDGSSVCTWQEHGLFALKKSVPFVFRLAR